MDFAWERMADDVLAVVDNLGWSDVKAAGHSMGGTALVLAELRRPGTFAGLWLFEPILFPASEGMPAGGNPLAAAARRRRPWFPDRRAAYSNFTAKPPLDSLDPAALRAYVDHGLRDLPDGEAVELKCTPEVEALVFDGGLSHDASDRLGELRAHVTVAVSGDARGPARAGPLIAAAIPHGRLERHPQLTHFGPMEDPPRIADAIRGALELGWG
jgi:pimeloyl-ACP methyl ester carboxylesterase